MQNLQPINNHKIAAVKLKNGIVVDLCYPKWQDLDSLLEYINTISKEDTFITMSGEQMTLADEASYLAGVISAIENGTAITVFAKYEGKVIGICGLHRKTPNRIRVSHRAELAISVAKEYRGLGLGKQFIICVINEAKKKMTGIKLIELDAFEINTSAVNLYQKLGFKIIGRLQNAYFYKGNYETSLIMALDI